MIRVTKDVMLIVTIHITKLLVSTSAAAHLQAQQIQKSANVAPLQQILAVVKQEDCSTINMQMAPMLAVAKMLLFGRVARVQIVKTQNVRQVALFVILYQEGYSRQLTAHLYFRFYPIPGKI